MDTAADGSLHQQPPPAEPENLSCPRCDSTNTKFCYYNNYNLSQPRYFCKSCRRFWTRGGTLRNIPVGGGTRKKSKRSRSSSSSSSAAAPVTLLPISSPPAVVNTVEMISPFRNCDDVEFDLNDEGSFTSLLNTTTNCNATASIGDGCSGVFTGLSGYGLGLGFEIGSSGFADIGFGFGASMAMRDETPHGVGQNDGSNTWQFGNGDVIDGSDCFGWPDLAISTPSNGLE